MDTGLSFWYMTLEPTLQREKNNRCRMRLETLKGSLLIFNLQSAPTQTQTGKLQSFAMRERPFIFVLI